MEFKEKYISTTANAALPIPSKTQIQLPDDAYAIGEMIQELIYKIEHTRVSLIH